MSARLSPGGALLRSSRMFSVPKPLSPAGGEAARVNRYQSPTATTPYPTHQAITTTEASRAVGDWGFKRCLPLSKTTKSSTPVVRIKQIDAFENVTDYSSGADHTLSLQKFHELNLPISQPTPNRSRLGHLRAPSRSVFEDADDFTTSKPGQDEEKRWKFKGPWLAGLTHGEFDSFLRRKVRNRREEFRAFLRERLAAEKNAEAEKMLLDAGQEAITEVHAKDITEGQLLDYLRRLRSDRITLYSLVSEFLDLAPLQPPSTLVNFGDSALNNKRASLYAENGPPISHPSGGLSYLRTAAFAENHPVYGPQAHQSPVLARILSPRTGPTSAKLGVGGFVTNVPQSDTFNQRSLRGINGGVAGIAHFDPDIEGGAKSFVKPVSARMDSSGHVQVTVDDADEEAQLIHRELLGKATIYNDRSEPEAQPEPRRPLVKSMPAWSSLSGARAKTSTNYGLNL